MIISRWILLRMRNASNKYRENQNINFILPKNRAIYEIISKNKVQQERTQTIWRLRLEYWKSKPAHTRAHTPTLTHTHTHTHTHTRAHMHMCNTYYFPRQQWFQESASASRDTYIAFLFKLLPYDWLILRPHIHWLLVYLTMFTKQWGVNKH
jgi:hypothetical protein